MPTYDFRCLICTKKNKEIIFSIKQTIKEYNGEGICPTCGTLSKSRYYTPVAVHEGLSAAEKTAGTTKHRSDLGKYMKSERTKRKKEAEPNSREAISNEYWVGNEVDRGVIDGPEKINSKKKV